MSQRPIPAVLRHPRLAVYSETDLYRAVADCLLLRAEQAIRIKGQFEFVATGGRTAARVYEHLRSADADWRRWHIYFSDERCLPSDDPDRNSQMLFDLLLSHVPVPADQIFNIPAELGNEVGAAAYRRVIKRVPMFDLVLLALGEDGHLASIFPGTDSADIDSDTEVLAVTHEAAPIIGWRISLSLNRLCKTHYVIVVASGESKRQSLSAALTQGTPLPLVQRLTQRAVTEFMVDRAAFDHRLLHGPVAIPLSIDYHRTDAKVRPQTREFC